MNVRILRAQLNSNWTIDEISSDEVEISENSGKTFLICGSDGLRERLYQTRYYELCDMGSFKKNLVAVCLRWGDMYGQHKRAEYVKNKILACNIGVDAQQIIYKELTKEERDFVDFHSNGSAEGKIVVFEKKVASLHQKEGIKQTCMAFVLDGKRIQLDINATENEKEKVIFYSKLAYASILIPAYLRFMKNQLTYADTMTILQLICFGLTGKIYIVNDVDRRAEKMPEKNKLEQRIQGDLAEETIIDNKRNQDNLENHLTKETAVACKRNEGKENDLEDGFIEENIVKNELDKIIEDDFLEETPIDNKIENNKEEILIERTIEKLTKKIIKETKNDLIEKLTWIDGPYTMMGNYRVYRTIIDERDTITPGQGRWWEKIDILEKSGGFVLEYRKGLQESHFPTTYREVCKHAKISEELANRDREVLLKLKPKFDGKLEKVETDKKKNKENNEQSFWRKIIEKFKWK